MNRPRWSQADDAELDLLVEELLNGYYDHLDRCDERPCSHLSEAAQTVLAWRRRRALLSEAAYLRARQDVTEWRQSA